MFFSLFLIPFLQVTQPAPAPIVPMVPVAYAAERVMIDAEITAYTSSSDETDATPQLNAGGTKPANGSLACPRRFDLGTAFVIQGKRYVCDDRMNKRYENRFDIWMTSRTDAIAFGVKTLPVEIVIE